MSRYCSKRLVREEAVVLLAGTDTVPYTRKPPAKCMAVWSKMMASYKPWRSNISPQHLFFFCLFGSISVAWGLQRRSAIKMGTMGYVLSPRLTACHPFTWSDTLSLLKLRSTTSSHQTISCLDMIIPSLQPAHHTGAF